MDPERHLRERLSLALRAEMPEYAALKAWQGYIAKQTGIKPNRVRDHMDCEHRLAAHDLLAYFKYFGPEFERRVRDQ